MTACQEQSSIAERRQRLGWSIYELAKRAGIRKWHTVRDADCGARRPQRTTLAKIEQALTDGESEEVFEKGKG